MSNDIINNNSKNENNIKCQIKSYIMRNKFLKIIN